MKSHHISRLRPLMRRLGGVLVYTAALLAAVTFLVSLSVPRHMVLTEMPASLAVSGVDDARGGETRITLQAKLFGAIPVGTASADVLPGLSLIPCGDVFGVKFFTRGVMVLGSTDIDTASGYVNPASLADLRTNDIITHVNGSPVNTVEELAETVEKSKGAILYVQYTRDGAEYGCELTPVLCKTDGRYKTGIWVRDSTAGIGTLTFYDPASGHFAGLGHGICDVDTGELMPLRQGTVVKVTVTDIEKGQTGLPGELKGSFDTRAVGSLSGNTAFGVYGTLSEAPSLISEPLPVADKKEVREGDAEILCNPDGSGVRRFAVRLSAIDRNSTGTKCFSVEVTDQALLALTGGIVQGMSGSPVIQNGKLVGAVTHVLIDDPRKGYGIFVQNMLAEAPFFDSDADEAA